jgi:HEAT repeat protein
LALVKSISDVQSLLLERLARGKARERSWSAIALGILERGRAALQRDGSPAVRAALRRALSDASAPDQVGAIAIGIGLCADRAATKDLLKKLDDVRDPIGRGHIATALGLLGAPEAKSPLRAILLKSRFQPELMRETAIALALLGDVELEPALLEELRNAKSLASQASVARALGFAGTLASVEPLAKMLGDSLLTAGARAFSAVALGMVCDRERTPWNAFLSIGVNYPSAPPTLSDGSAGILDIL